MWRWLHIACLALGLSFAAKAALASTPGDFIALAAARGLGSAAPWQRLLFYQRHSPVRPAHGVFDDPLFYLAPGGKTDSQAELEATITAFFAAPNKDAPDEHALCRFPARRAYLEAELAGLSAALPKHSCPNFALWWRDRHYESASLAFSAYFPDNPASMFGHLFIRLHRRGGSKGSDLLDDAVNFAANPDIDNPLLYNLRGAFGGFPGRFALLPYYMKIQEYNNVESRDLWEYPVAMNQQQIQRLLYSLWEVGPHFSDYYYFDDNCSFAILLLLEAAEPRWDFTARLPMWATPSSCLLAAAAEPQFMQSSRFRPSARSRYEERYDMLNQSERASLATVIEEAKSAGTPAPVLDTVLEYIDFKEKIGGMLKPVRLASLRQETLSERSQHESAPMPLKRLPEANDPRTAVPESFLQLSAGQRDGYALLRLSWQPVLHDLLGDARGYMRDMHLQIMPMSFSWEPPAKALSLERLSLLQILSLSPRQRELDSYSWGFDLGYKRQSLCLDPGATRCAEAFIGGSQGIAWALGKSANAPVLASLVGIKAGGQQGVEQRYGLVQMGPEVLVYGRAQRSLAYLLRAEWYRRLSSIDTADWLLRTEAQLSIPLASRGHELRLSSSWEERRWLDQARVGQEVAIGYLQYF